MIREDIYNEIYDEFIKGGNTIKSLTYLEQANTKYITFSAEKENEEIELVEVSPRY